MDLMRFLQTLILGVVIYGLSISVAASEDEAEPGIVEFRSLSVGTAKDAAWAAIKDCRRRGYSVAVAIVVSGID